MQIKLLKKEEYRLIKYLMVNNMSTIKIKQVRSKIRRPKNQKSTLVALGLKGIGHVVEHKKTPSIEGMIEKVKHLIKVVE